MYDQDLVEDLQNRVKQLRVSLVIVLGLIAFLAFFLEHRITNLEREMEDKIEYCYVTGHNYSAVICGS